MNDLLVLAVSIAVREMDVSTEIALLKGRELSVRHLGKEQCETLDSEFQLTGILALRRQ